MKKIGYLRHKHKTNQDYYILKKTLCYLLFTHYLIKFSQPPYKGDYYFHFIHEKTKV